VQFFERYSPKRIVTKMSYRSSMSDGHAAVFPGDYYGTPGEFDPMGGNAGTETPYVAEPPPPPDPGPIMPYYPTYDDAPMMVNVVNGVNRAILRFAREFPEHRCLVYDLSGLSR
jgi:hypothetical protein